MAKAAKGKKAAKEEKQIATPKAGKEKKAGKLVNKVVVPDKHDRIPKVVKTASGAIMVLGGGVAGVQAALDLTELGYYVYLVEKSAAIGGVMAQLDKTFPTNDCAL